MTVPRSPRFPRYKGECKHCQEPGIGYNDDGELLCEDCLFDEAIDEAMPKIVAGEEPPQ